MVFTSRWGKKGGSIAKYRLSEQSILDIEHGVVLYRIIAEQTFETIERVIKKGDIGGYISSYDNLSQIDKCWVDDNAKVLGQAKVLENAFLKGNCTVSDDAEICGFAKIAGCAIIRENALISGECRVEDNAIVEGNVFLKGNIKVCENATITGDVYAEDCCVFSGNSYIYGKSTFQKKIETKDDVIIGGHAILDGYIMIKDRAVIKEHATISGHCAITGSVKILGYSKVMYDVGGATVINKQLHDTVEIQPFLKRKFIEVIKKEEWDKYIQTR